MRYPACKSKKNPFSRDIWPIFGPKMAICTPQFWICAAVPEKSQRILIWSLLTMQSAICKFQHDPQGSIQDIGSADSKKPFWGKNRAFFGTHHEKNSLLVGGYTEKNSYFAIFRSKWILTPQMLQKSFQAYFGRHFDTDFELF